MWIEDIEGLLTMSEKSGGNFSSSLLSLQLQLKTLLEGAGGDAALKFLDTLSALNQSEQKLALSIFTKVIEQIKNGEQRLCTKEDKVLHDFEENLYKDILSSMREAANEGERHTIEVIDGGRSRACNGKNSGTKTPIDLAEARRLRRAKHKPLLN